MNKYQDYVEDANGNVLAGATVTVKAYPGLTTATIYESDGVTTKTNPITTDSQGGYSFYAAAGHYSLTMSHARISTKTVQDIYIGIDTASSVGGTMPIVNGGTGQTTAVLAINALMPSQTNKSKMVMHSDGSIVSWGYPTGYVIPQTHDDEGVQAAINYALANNLECVLLEPNVTYTINSAVFWSTAGAGDGKALHLRCMGQCIFDASTLAVSNPIIQWAGTSGEGGVHDLIEGILFKGSGPGNGQVAIQLLGMVGARVRHCRFEDLEQGVQFWNNTPAGSFTEDCLVTDCYFSRTKYCVSYRRTVGADTSFHGTGLVGHNVCNLDDGYSAVYIMTGAQPYNAPLEGLMFDISTAGITVVNNQSTNKSWFKGWIRFEGSRDGFKSICNPNPIAFSGPIFSNGGTWSSGACALIEDLIANADGSFTTIGERKRVQIDNYSSGLGIIGVSGAWRYTVTLREEGTGLYDYRYSFIGMANDYSGVGSVNNEAAEAMVAVNTAAYGAPVFTVNSNSVLVATQAGLPTTGVTLYCDAVQMSQSLNYSRLVGHARINDLYACTFRSADANATTDIITVTGGHNFITGQQVRYSEQSSGKHIVSLTSGSYYFVVKLSATTLNLASSFANATAGSPTIIDFGTVDASGFFQLFTY